MDTLFSDESFHEVLMWGGIVLIGLIALIIVGKILKFGITSKIHGTKVPFAMTAADLDTMKEKAGLTPEEAKAIRSAMVRQYMERTKAEEKSGGLPPKAELILSEIAAHPEVVISEAKQQQPPPFPPSLAPQPIAKKAIPPLGNIDPSPLDTARAYEALRVQHVTPSTDLPPLPDKLLHLLHSSDMEWDQMRDAGFLSQEDVELLRRHREAL